MDLSVVIPVYNEERNISQMVEELHKHIPVSFEIIVVYDFDEDTTVPIVKSLMQRYTNLRSVKNTISRGPSGAIRTGLQHARGKNVLVTMADLCDDLSQIKEFLRLVPAEADVVCPSRYCVGGDQELKESLKKWIPRWAGFFIHHLSGMTTRDPTNSYKFYSKKVLNEMELESTASFSVTLEIVAKAHCLGYRIKEIPTVWRDRQAGKSNFNLVRSLFTYLPWFFVAVSGNPLWRRPKSKYHWYKTPKEPMSMQELALEQSAK